MWTFETLTLIGLTFLAAGFVKGIVGLGMPTIVLGITVPVLGLETGIALMLIPALVTNFWLALAGPNTKRLALQLWPMLVTICLGITVGVRSLVNTDPRIASAMLGGLIATHSAISLFGPTLPHPGRHERWLSPVLGIINGVITGFTGSSVIPAALYLQALGYGKDEFVQAIGMIFGVSLLILTVTLAGFSVLTWDLFLLSCVGLAPAFFGMWLGAILRVKISEERFRRILLVALLLVGLHITLRALAG